ncbi:MAG: hypothetical protein IBJ11_04270 [Phycisphaerales bacterium]|nr:hypothetical protein [Phycisphaerales bacterium]
MTPAPPSADARSVGPARAERAKRRQRLIGTALGLALLGLAAWAVLRAAGSPAAAIAPLRDASPASVALLVGLIAVGPLLTGATFWVLTRRYGAVGFVEMTALMAGSWLLNFLPLKPGLFGRLAYHKAVNGIAITDSAKALIWANVLSLAGAALMAASALIAAMFVGGDHPLMLAAVAAPAPALALFAWHAARVRPAADPEVWRVLAAAALRYAELLVWAARFMVCFALIDRPIAPGAAAALAGVTAAVQFVPITGNGLGVREWAVGLLAPVLPVGLAAQAGLTTAQGLTADLAHRAAEIPVAIVLGLVGLAYAARRTRGRAAAGGPAATLDS